MSQTTLYGVNDSGNLLRIKQFNNAWLSAPMLWDYLVVKFGLCARDAYTSPSWEKLWETTGFGDRLSDPEWWTLMSTYDRSLLPREHVPAMAGAMRQMHHKLRAYNPANNFPPSFDAQAAALEKHVDDYQFFAWNQTSVADAWPSVVVRGCDKYADDRRRANILLDDEHADYFVIGPRTSTRGRGWL